MERIDDTRRAVRRGMASAARRGMALTVLVAWACGAGDEEPAADAPDDTTATVITFRQFSAAPSIGRGQGSSDPQDADYGALRIFLDKVEAKTEALGPGRRVRFSPEAGASTVSEISSNTYAAGYVSGGSLNGTWGFVYNSVPFGPAFPQMVDFFYAGNGIQVANQIYADRGVNVVAFPVVGSPDQMSGYFKAPVGVPQCSPGDADCARSPDGVGLEGLCGSPWALRYLPPAESILDRACDGLPGAQLTFVQAIPGGSELLTAIQVGSIQGLEFATPIDDYDAAKGGIFANAQTPEGSDGRNAGEIGLRFAHYPAWHQPFFMGWMMVNRTQAWERLDPDQRAAIEEAAREAVADSYDASRSIQCAYLQRILDLNNGRTQRGAPGGPDVSALSADVVLTEWANADLARLRRAALEHLESLRGGSDPTGDQADYATVIDALRQHLGYTSIAQMLDAWEAPTFPAEAGCVTS